MTVELLDFGQALNKAETYGKKHLLLGNGFSIACKPDIFAYGSLLKKPRRPCQKSLQRYLRQWAPRTSRKLYVRFSTLLRS